MARLAIFIDGGYMDVLAEQQFRRRVNYESLCNEIRGIVAAKTAEPLDLLRTYYYHCFAVPEQKPET